MKIKFIVFFYLFVHFQNAAALKVDESLQGHCHQINDIMSVDFENAKTCFDLSPEKIAKGLKDDDFDLLYKLATKPNPQYELQESIGRTLSLLMEAKKISAETLINHGKVFIIFLIKFAKESHVCFDVTKDIPDTDEYLKSLYKLATNSNTRKSAAVTLEILFEQRKIPAEKFIKNGFIKVFINFLDSEKDFSDIGFDGFHYLLGFRKEQAIIDAGALPHLIKSLSTKNQEFKAANSLSHILFVRPDSAPMAIKHGLIDSLEKLMKSEISKDLTEQIDFLLYYVLTNIQILTEVQADKYYSLLSQLYDHKDCDNFVEAVAQLFKMVTFEDQQMVFMNKTGILRKAFIRLKCFNDDYRKHAFQALTILAEKNPQLLIDNGFLDHVKLFLQFDEVNVDVLRVLDKILPKHYETVKNENILLMIVDLLNHENEKIRNVASKIISSIVISENGKIIEELNYYGVVIPLCQVLICTNDTNTMGRILLTFDAFCNFFKPVKRDSMVLKKWCWNKIMDIRNMEQSTIVEENLSLAANFLIDNYYHPENFEEENDVFENIPECPGNMKADEEEKNNFEEKRDSVQIITFKMLNDKQKNIIEINGKIEGMFKMISIYKDEENIPEAVKYKIIDSLEKIIMKSEEELPIIAAEKIIILLKQIMNDTSELIDEQKNIKIYSIISKLFDQKNNENLWIVINLIFSNLVSAKNDPRQIYFILKTNILAKIFPHLKYLNGENSPKVFEALYNFGNESEEMAQILLDNEILIHLKYFLFTSDLNENVLKLILCFVENINDNQFTAVKKEKFIPLILNLLNHKNENIRGYSGRIMAAIATRVHDKFIFFLIKTINPLCEILNSVQDEDTIAYVFGGLKSMFKDLSKHPKGLRSAIVNDECWENIKLHKNNENQQINGLANEIIYQYFSLFEFDKRFKGKIGIFGVNFDW